MRLYHFLNAEYGIKNLKARRLKIARIMELNDIFEFLGVDISNREFRRLLKETKKELSKTKGLLCFSETWNNPVLWGHYADKHKGICLGFEVPRVEKVDYVECRFPPPLIYNEEFMKKLLFTKFKHWEYEREYRRFVTLEEEINGLYYAQFSDQLRLKCVIVGAESEVTCAQITEALGSLGEGVNTFKARAGFSSFEVVENKNKAMWV